MKLFVWDFHGVLETGNERAALEVSNRVLEAKGYAERFTEADADTLYGRKWYQYFEYLLPNEPRERHVALQEAAFAYDEAHPEIVARYMRPNEYALVVLERIAQRHRQILISNTNPGALRMFIEAVEMQSYFTEANAFAVNAHRLDAQRTKQHVLADYLEQNPAEELVIVGDSASDMALAEVAGGTRYHYVHEGRAFKDCEAEYKIRDLRLVLGSL